MLRILTQTPDFLIKPDIRGAVKKQNELGLEVDLFKNKAGFSLTYWWGNESGIPQAIQIPSYSGFTSMLANSGKIEKSGIDISLTIYSFAAENLSMKTNLIFSRLLNQRIISIGDNITKITTQDFWGSTVPFLVMAKGRQWGELYGSGKKMVNGKPVLTSSGHYVADPEKYFGSVIPDFSGGLQNTMKVFKDFTVNIGIDYQFGGKFFSLSDKWGTFSGLTARTAVLNDKGKPIRTPVADGGGVHVSGVDQFTGADVEYFVEAQDYFHSLISDRCFDEFIYSSTYIKLRELSVSYRVPLKKLRPERLLPDVTISIYSQNLWMIYAAQRKFDPSELTYIGGERGQFPSLRSFGFNLKVCF